MSAAAQRQALADLSSVAASDLRDVWAGVRALPQRDVAPALSEALGALGDMYGDAAAALAADFYADERERAAAPGRFVPVLADRPTRERWESLARWGAAPLLTDPEGDRVALTRLGGGLQRSIADQHRLTVVRSSSADPAASGWRRVGVGGSCGFCRMLIDRGHVYADDTVTFRSHDHCNCAAAPSFAPNVTRVSNEPYRQSKSRRSASTKRADNKRAYQYIADVYGDH